MLHDEHKGVDGLLTKHPGGNSTQRRLSPSVLFTGSSPSSVPSASLQCLHAGFSLLVLYLNLAMAAIAKRIIVEFEVEDPEHETLWCCQHRLTETRPLG